MLPTTFYQKIPETSIDTRIPLERNHAHQVQILGFYLIQQACLPFVRELLTILTGIPFHPKVCSLDP